MYHIDDYTFSLADERIAQTPAFPADSCKLMIANRTNHTIHDTTFTALPEILARPCLFVRNVTKVIKARITLTSFSGEILVLALQSPNRAVVLVRPGKKFRVGTTIALPEIDGEVTVVAETEEGRILDCSRPREEIMNLYGHLPLPPYIASTAEKETHYQTVFAQDAGSVAAPTASLHFTKPLMQRLSDAGQQRTDITLHVGIGTFKPISAADIRDHRIHPEQISIALDLFDRVAKAKETGMPVIAIGTTVTRTLESLPALWSLLTDATKQRFSADTQRWRDEKTTENAAENSFLQDIVIDDERINGTSCLYIRPGHQWQIVDHLITNFHLPKSSLLVLVDAFLQGRSWRDLYDHALSHDYRFFSFGDAMLIV